MSPIKKRRKVEVEDFFSVQEPPTLRRSGRQRKPLILKQEIEEESDKDITASEESSDEEFRVDKTTPLSSDSEAESPNINPLPVLSVPKSFKSEKKYESPSKFSFKSSTIPKKSNIALSDEESDSENLSLGHNSIPTSLRHNSLSREEEECEEGAELTADAWSTHLNALSIQLEPKSSKISNKNDPKSVFALLKQGEKLKEGEEGSIRTIEPVKAVPSTSKSVEITIQAPEVRKKGKKAFDVEGYIKKQLTKERNTRQLYLHKVSVLCLIAHGRSLNTLLNAPELFGLALSLIPGPNSFPPKRTNLSYVEKLMGFVRDKFECCLGGTSKGKRRLPIVSIETLSARMSQLRVQNEQEWVYLFIVFCRALGLLCRLVMSLQPLPLKIAPVREIKLKEQGSTDEEAKKRLQDDKSDDESDMEVVEDSQDSQEAQSAENALSSSKSRGKAIVNKNTPTKQKKEVEKRGSGAKTSRGGTKAEVTPKKGGVTNSVGAENKQWDGARNAVGRKERRGGATASRGGVKGGVTPEKVEHGKLNLKRKNSETVEEKKGRGRKKAVKQDSDEDFEESLTKRGSRKVEEVKGNKGRRKEGGSKEDKFVRALSSKSRKVISSDSESDNEDGQVSKVKRGKDVWAEVYLEEEEKWLAVDIVHGKLDCCRVLESAATKPLLYVLAFNVNNTIKDVTPRYDLHYATKTKRARVEEKWWTATLKPFEEAKTIRSRREDEEMGSELIERPLPTSIAEYKNHPLYALQRHLLKFEAIYPSSAMPVGFIRGEAVYARDCVHTLHSRETWLKQAKAVRLGEKPYKIAKSRPKWDKYTQTKITDQPLELFGSWQVEDYVPPPAVNGVVPRNAYGNVELFQPSMLPKGTRHLQIPGLNRVARSLDIDCAPAMTGWDFHGGGSHPVFDGFVVCEEHVETLLDAWQAKQDEQSKHEKEKKEKRVWGNWRKLIKGLLIKKKLELKYQLGDVD